MDDVEVYSEGLCYMSVCSSLGKDETEARIRATKIAGTSNGWRITEEPFRTGAANGCPCPDHEGRHHWLFAC